MLARAHGRCPKAYEQQGHDGQEYHDGQTGFHMGTRDARIALLGNRYCGHPLHR